MLPGMDGLEVLRNPGWVFSRGQINDAVKGRDEIETVRGGPGPCHLFNGILANLKENLTIRE